MSAESEKLLLEELKDRLDPPSEEQLNQAIAKLLFGKNAEKMLEDLQHLNEMDGPAFKIKEDPRQTRVGRFLRITSLDEFPQLLNVLKGDMSLIGPRPPIIEEVLQYRPWERKRLSVVQGISCFWQVSGRNEIKFDEWMKLDILYIENRSLTIDFIIMLRTIPAVLSRRGAN